VVQKTGSTSLAPQHLVDLSTGDQSPIAHDDDLPQTEPFAQLGDLGPQRGGIPGVDRKTSIATGQPSALQIKP
jgi:hypothetical protein